MIVDFAMRIIRQLTRFLHAPARGPAVPAGGVPPAAMEGQAPQVMEAVSRLAGGIAHDLNNILLVVQGYTEMALGENDAGPETRAHLAEVRDAAARAAAMVADLLVVGCRSPCLPRPVDVNAVLAAQVPDLQGRAGSAVQVRFAPGKDLPTVMADAGQVGRVTAMLCARAAEAMPGGGIIELATLAPSDRGTGGRVLLRISDTGPRIGDSERAHIFEPYFSLAQGGKGNGLRLSLVRGIVKRFGGEISLASGGEPGTTFVISLPCHGDCAEGLAVDAPLHRQELPAPPAAPVSRAGGDGPTILVADDDEALRMLAVKILTREGFTVLAARDGQEAVEVFERHGERISLVLLDDVMPRMGGRAALARIRQRVPGLPAILCSGYTWSFDGEEKDNEPCIILPKPWHARELLLRLREGLGVS